MSAGSATTAPVVATHWPARPAWSRTVRALVTAVPLATGLAAAGIASRTLATPRPGTAPWWACVFAIATVATVAVATAARRFLPLAALLELSLAFPGPTPSRIGVAMRAASPGRLRRQVERLDVDGPDRDEDAGHAAEAALELATALDHHDARARWHCERVRELSDLIAEEMRLSPEDRDRLRWAALLHDCDEHPRHGVRLPAPLAEWLGPWSRAIEDHHERWDGSGHPRGLARQEISVGGRIVAVADSFELRTAARSPNRPVTAGVARTELARQAGHQFDPDVVRALLAVSVGRLRWLVGPFSWLAELSVIRSAVQAPAVTAPAALMAITLAAASALGVVTPLGQGRAAGAPPVSAADARATPADDVDLADDATADQPVDVLAEAITVPAPSPAAPATSLPDVPDPTPTVVAVVGPLPDALPAPGNSPPLCTPDGEPPAGAVVDALGCGVVEPVEGLLAGLLDEGPMAEIVGNLALLP